MQTDIHPLTTPQIENFSKWYERAARMYVHTKYVNASASANANVNVNVIFTATAIVIAIVTVVCLTLFFLLLFLSLILSHLSDTHTHTHLITTLFVSIYFHACISSLYSLPPIFCCVVQCIVFRT